ncbi:hypothetical protein BC828DRAFT_397946 [Blastocladiella britannica]|nr:hypothetical protein BC828DRAFT_397946 [Blastocladiella britannica]
MATNTQRRPLRLHSFSSPHPASLVVSCSQPPIQPPYHAIKPGVFDEKVDAMESDMYLPVSSGKSLKVTTTTTTNTKANELDAPRVKGKITITNNVLTTIQAIDIALRRDPAKKTMIAAGCSFYDPRTPLVPLSNGLDLPSGAFISARVGLSGLTLNLDTAYTAFYRPMPLIDYAALVLRVPVANLA